MRHSLRLALVLLALAVLLGGTPVAAAEGWTGRFSVYRAGSFSSQVNDRSCVGASVQMMLNIIFQRSQQSADKQRMYWRYAREHSRYADRIKNGGADPKGWALALRHWGAGYYRVGGKYTRQGSLKQAAKRMRLTGKPVGLLVQEGGHAWVMTGFQATADPAKTTDFKVTGVQAMGSLWPDGTINGRPYDPAPKTWLTMRQIRNKFLAYRWKPATTWNGRWITVIP
jgi:hypothetical protein